MTAQYPAMPFGDEVLFDSTEEEKNIKSDSNFSRHTAAINTVERRVHNFATRIFTDSHLERLASAKKTGRKKAKRLEEEKLRKVPFIKRVLKELGITDNNFCVIGHGSHHFTNGGLRGDAATARTLVSYLVVDLATYTWLQLGKNLVEIKVGQHRLLPLLGEGAHGQGGISFVLCTKDLLPTYNNYDQIYNFLVDLINFDSLMSSTAALNIAAYLASCPAYSEKFFQQFTYDFLKKKMMRESNRGQVLFFEPRYFWEAVCEVNRVREVPGWFCVSGMTHTLCEQFRKVEFFHLDALEREDYDKDVLQLHVCLGDPEFRHADGQIHLQSEFVKDGPLFQTPVEPDPKVATDYDPNI